MRAVAFRGVEREGVGRRLTERESAFLVHEVLGKMAYGVLAHVVHRHRTLSQGQGRSNGAPRPHSVGFGRFEPVHDKLNKMCLIPVQGVDFPQFPDFRIHADLRVSLLSQLLEQLLV